MLLCEARKLRIGDFGKSTRTLLKNYFRSTNENEIWRQQKCKSEERWYT